MHAVVTPKQAKREGKKDKTCHIPEIIGAELEYSPGDVMAQEKMLPYRR